MLGDKVDAVPSVLCTWGCTNMHRKPQLSPEHVVVDMLEVALDLAAYVGQDLFLCLLAEAARGHGRQRAPRPHSAAQAQRTDGQGARGDLQSRQVNNAPGLTVQQCTGCAQAVMDCTASPLQTAPCPS